MEIKENIYYVGVLDEGLKTFDVIMNTKYGSSYNSYLVKGKNKVALIETVKSEFADEFIKNIEKYVKISDIDYLIVNHTEPDHAGSIGKLLKINGTLLDKNQLENHLKKIAANHNIKSKSSKETYPVPEMLKNFEFIKF